MGVSSKTAVPRIAGRGPASARILILLNPGRTSRHYMLGLARAAQRLGILAGTLEMDSIWRRLSIGTRGGGPEPAVRRQVAREVLGFCTRARVTHILGYLYNGVAEFGVATGTDGRPEPVLAQQGIRHLLLWTDHPNWAVSGAALKEPARSLLAHPALTHIVKSEAAAEELREVCAWPNVLGLPMAEDYETMRPARAPSSGARHDAVVILGDAAPPPEPVHPFLSEDDPDPQSLMDAMRPSARSTWSELLREWTPPSEIAPALERLGDALIDQRADRPLCSVWRLSQRLPPEHSAALRWLRASPARWYKAVAALGLLTAWRRSFYLAWLGRRVDLGVYGEQSSRLGLPTPPGADRWVEYEQQPEVYAAGRVVININAAHDEEGLTHKPFQIAAAGAPCIHHASLGMDRAFEPGEEIEVFQRASGLLECVRRLAADDRRSEALGAAMRRRASREHNWEARLTAILRWEERAGLHAVESAA